MADMKITALDAATIVDLTNDELVMVDVSDTAMDASGTTKKVAPALVLDAANLDYASDVLSLRRSTNAQSLRIYASDDGAGNAGWLGVDWSSADCNVGVSNSGTGLGGLLTISSGTKDLILRRGETQHIRLGTGGTKMLQNLVANNTSISLGSPTEPFGNLYLRPSSSLTPTANGDLCIEATNNTTLTFKFKGSDGTVRSGTVALS